MQRVKWIVFITVLLFLSGSLFYAVSVPYNRSDIRAAEGVLEVDGQTMNDLIVPLSGEWEFYPMQFLEPPDFTGTRPEGGEAISLPGSWNHAAGYPLAGYATFRLRIRLPEAMDLMLFVPEIDSAAVLWIDGERVMDIGTVGTAKDQVTTACINRYLPFHAQRETELVIHTANYTYATSGLTYGLEIGRPQIILRDAFLRRGLYVLVLGGILLLSLYHMILYLFRRKESAYLLFALMCLTVFLQFLMETNGLWQLVTDRGICLPVYQVYLFLYATHLLLLFLFTKAVFELRFHKITLAVCVGLYTLEAIVNLLLPPISSGGLWARMILLPLPALLIIVKAALSKKIREEPMLLLYLLSIILYFITIGVIKLIDDSLFYMPGLAGVTFMLLSQCIVLANRYVQAFRQVESTNRNLEGLVAERTQKLKQTNEQLVLSQSALKEMLGNISHDLKTPLTVLSTHLELLNMDHSALSEDERTHYLKVAYNKNLDLQRLIHNLFEVTRMETGRIVYHLDWIEADVLLGRIRGRYIDYLAGRRITLATSIGQQGVLSADQEKIWSVFDNLIYNAVRYTKPGGSITVDVERTQPGCITITVADTGSGIAPAHLPHIFERFYKASSSRGENSGDSGLGLYIVKTAMEAMGGSVRAESEEGVGTIFYLTFVSR